MKRFLKDKRIDNTWAVIKLKDLPNDLPVIGISEFTDKSLANFHLVEWCIIPKQLEIKIKESVSETLYPKS